MLRPPFVISISMCLQHACSAHPQCSTDLLSTQAGSQATRCTPGQPATALHAMLSPWDGRASLRAEFALCCAHPFRVFPCSVPAQPATALHCSADPLSAQAGTPGDQERAFAAVAAATRRGGASEAVLDALEAAESQSQATPAHREEDAHTASAEGQQGGISPGAMQAGWANACEPRQCCSLF